MIGEASPKGQADAKTRRCVCCGCVPQALARRSINNLAFGYGRAHKLDLALPLFREALKLRQAKLGPDHPDTLVAMNNRGILGQQWHGQRIRR